VGHAAQLRQMRNSYMGAVIGIGFIRLRTGSVVGSYEDGNKPSGSIKDGEFYDKLHDY